MTDETHSRDADSTEAVTRAHHDWGSGSQLSLTVVDAIAAHRATAPTELAPLYEIVDLEALETLVDSFSRTDGRVTFTYDDHDVTVDADGRVVVRNIAADGGAIDDEAAFEAALTRLVLTAAASGVTPAGSWTCTGGRDGPGWVIDIAERT